jgi:hypothetical protein
VPQSGVAALSDLNVSNCVRNQGTFFEQRLSLVRDEHPGTLRRLVNCASPQQRPGRLPVNGQRRPCGGTERATLQDKPAAEDLHGRAGDAFRPGKAAEVKISDYGVTCLQLQTGGGDGLDDDLVFADEGDRLVDDDAFLVSVRLDVDPRSGAGPANGVGDGEAGTGGLPANSQGGGGCGTLAGLLLPDGIVLRPQPGRTLPHRAELLLTLTRPVLRRGRWRWLECDPKQGE